MHACFGLVESLHHSHSHSLHLHPHHASLARYPTASGLRGEVFLRLFYISTPRLASLPKLRPLPPPRRSAQLIPLSLGFTHQWTASCPSHPSLLPSTIRLSPPRSSPDFPAERDKCRSCTAFPCLQRATQGHAARQNSFSPRSVGPLQLESALPYLVVATGDHPFGTAKFGVLALHSNDTFVSWNHEV